MKIESNQSANFVPVTITFTCETAEDLLYLLGISNIPSSAAREGAESLGANIAFDDTQQMPVFGALKDVAKKAGIIV